MTCLYSSKSFDHHDGTITSSATATSAAEKFQSSIQSLHSASYRVPTAPKGIALNRFLSNKFPLSYIESYLQWKNRPSLGEAEAQLLSLLPFFPETDGSRAARSLQVSVGGGNHINEFEISRVNEIANNPEHLVMLHGYGAGLGFFYKNFDDISKVSGWTVHALDLLGYGNSSRPKFRVKAKRPLDAILEAENFFIDALEKWRVERGVSEFTLVAHSLGAYLGCAYAIKYPGRVKKLMLASPAAVPDNDYAISEEDLLLTGGPLRTQSHFGFISFGN